MRRRASPEACWGTGGRAVALGRAVVLAKAHDTQPYPTAWAYEQACKALENAKRELTSERRSTVAEEINEDMRDYWADHVKVLEHTIAEMAAKHVALAEENERLKGIGTARCIDDLLFGV